MSSQEPLGVGELLSVPPDEPDPEDDPPPDPDEVDDPEASTPEEAPLEEEAPPEDVGPPEPEAPPPELELGPESFGVSGGPPVPPMGPQATLIKRTTVGTTLRRRARLLFATSSWSLPAIAPAQESGRMARWRRCGYAIRIPTARERRGDSRELDVLLGFILRRILGDDSAEMRALVRGAIDAGPGPDYPWPGNVRELEQCVRRVLLTRRYTGDRRVSPNLREPEGDERLLEVAGDDTARALLVRYCQALYARHGTYEEVARRTALDRRTVKAYVSGVIARQ